MWPFSSAKPKVELSPEQLDLFQRQDKLERLVRDMRLDWDDMYEKFRLLYARAAKRIREATALEEKNTPEETAEDAPRLAIGDHPILGHPLNHRGPRVPKRNY